jgi:DEAD/DEAH box helicase
MAKESDVLGLARALSAEMAGAALTPSFAKLYSQHTRLNAGQPGLGQWRTNEAASRFEDAVRLVDAALYQRGAGEALWFEAMLRAAEVMEWLSHPVLNPDRLPMRLLAAAGYQLAGYPARAAGMLNVSSESTLDSDALRALLSGDFPALIRSLMTRWAANPRHPTDSVSIAWLDETRSAVQLRKFVEDETASALGILCAAMRWGSDDRVDAALEKLRAVSKVMLNGHDRYSWLLAKLVSETCATFVETSLRKCLTWLPLQLDGAGGLAVERYMRQAYLACKTQAWPSQRRGIERLEQGNSFVLCTPTGSGKTTVAEIAILQRLFSTDNKATTQIAPLVMYLVPKRALAAEVEAKLLRTLAPLSDERIVITGLYGGIDWGPTDAWLTSDDKTVLICTYEKAEALIRFLGPLFLSRLSLVVLDEAHMVQFDGREEDLRSAESRPLRLESLIARLLVHVPAEQSRIIALSAVATGMENTLAKWITGEESASPAGTRYRSTRQLIGRLQCKARRAFDIRYDLLDRASLRFTETGEGGTPYIPSPFPAYPAAPSFETAGPEKRLRPYLFWAAMHLVAPSKAGRRHAVLVSIPQRIGGYAQDLLDLLEDDWAKIETPVVFQPPDDPEKLEKWQRCLQACEDYFGQSSREYRLLRKGIVAHHGKMPGLMSRLLVQLVDDGVVHLILATSTLSEGVNLPFEVILLPTLRRGKDWMSAREFANLAGRAGRPGHGTEGRCLVLVPSDPNDWSGNQLVQKYEDLIRRLELRHDAPDSSTGGRSALAELLVSLRTQWETVSKSASETEFLRWLEVTATLSAPDTEPFTSTAGLIETLDSLDSVLLAAIVEIESLAGVAISSDDLEGKLAEIWRRCYAHYASDQEAALAKWFLGRGRALTARIYPDARQRRGLYRTGLPPRLGAELMLLYPTAKQHLLTGADYAQRSADERFEFIKILVDILSRHPKFALANKTPGKTPWEDILRWWLDPLGPIPAPTAKQVSDWYDYVAANFSYRIAWGIGCMLAIAADEAHDGELQPTTLERWDDTGLPWIALWLKELIVWGTLDPVSAYLLGRGRAGTRTAASAIASQYFETNQELQANEMLNPSTIAKWADALSRPVLSPSKSKPQSTIKVKLEREFPVNAARRWRVLPAEIGAAINWVDPAGFVLAVGERPPSWNSTWLQDADFFLDVDSQTVSFEPFL